MSAFVNLDAVAEELTVDLVEYGMSAERREEALGRWVYALSAHDQVAVLAHTTGTLLALIEALKTGNPTTRVQVDATVRAWRGTQQKGTSHGK